MAHSSQLAEYLVCFNMLVSRVVWGKAALCFQFYDSLPDGLKDCLGLLGKPDSLWELVHTTQHFDNLYWERQEEQKLARSRDNRSTGGPALKTPTSGGGQQPNHANDKTHSPDGKLKPEERKHCHENNLCVICSRGDHKVVACTVYTKGRASHLRMEEVQTLPKAAEPLQSPEVAKMTGRPGKLTSNPSQPTLPKGCLQIDRVPHLHLNTTSLSPNSFFLLLTSPSTRNPLRPF